MAFDIAKTAEGEGHTVSIVSVHCIKPLDLDGIRQVLEEHKSVVVIEEMVPHGGLGSKVKEIAWDHGLDVQLKAYSLKDEFMHVYGNHAELLKSHRLTAEFISKDILNAR